MLVGASLFSLYGFYLIRLLYKRSIVFSRTDLA
jgi:hypothetical protein